MAKAMETFEKDFIERVGQPEFYTPGTKPRVPFAKLVDQTYSAEAKGLVRLVHIGKVGKNVAWADGFMLEIKPVPEKLKKLKGYTERRKTTEGKPRDFANLVPDYSVEGIEVVPILKVPPPEWASQLKGGLTLLASRTNDQAIAIDTKYAGYFISNYPDAKFIMKSGSVSSPIVVQSKGKTVGVAMPLFLESGKYDVFLRYMRQDISPKPMPSPPEPAKAKKYASSYSEVLKAYENKAEAHKAILEGFRNIEEAKEHAQGMRGDDVIFTAKGIPIDKKVILAVVAKETKPTPVTPEPKVERGKEAWEMTRGEFVSQREAETREGYAGHIGLMPKMDESWRNRTGGAHEQLVEDAIREGKPVPLEVLKDYPDLKPVTPEPKAKRTTKYFTLKKAQDVVRAIPKNLTDEQLQKHIVKLRDFKGYIDRSDMERLVEGGYYGRVMDPSATGLVPKDPWLQTNLGSSLDEALAEKQKRLATPEVAREAVGNLKVGDTFTGKLGTGFPEVELWEKIAESPRKGVTIRNVSTGETRTLNPVQAVYMREPAPKPKAEKVRKVKPLPIHNQTEWEAIPIGARKDTARVAGLKSKVGLKGWGGLTENEKLALRSFPHPYGKTTMELQRIHSKRTPLSQASDERQKHQVTIEPDSPRVKQWIKDPGTADISGIDTPPISKRSSLGRKGTQRITPKTPKLRR